MTDVQTERDFRDVESMVRDAGQFLDVTDDLRPRTMEAARTENTENSTRFWIELAAVAVILLSLTVHKVLGYVSSASPVNASFTANTEELFSVAERKSVESNQDVSWSLVEAFHELRAAQSSVFEKAF